MQPRHHRPAHGLLDPHPDGVHADVRLGVDEPDDGKDQGEHQGLGSDSYEGENEIDHGPCDHGRPARAETFYHEAAQR